MQWPFHVWKDSISLPHPPALTFFPLPLALMLPEFWVVEGVWREVNIQVPFSSDDTTALYCQHFDQLWVSSLIVSHCKKALL